jgi:PAS domain S-box-containing protein
VVDDDVANREILGRQLEKQGYSVQTAGSGHEALELLKSRGFDLLVLDIVMPDCDGFQVLQKIRSEEALAAIPVVMLSALDELESAAGCLEMGAADFLWKPVDPRLLRVRIESLLSRRSAEIERAQMAERFRLLLESTAEGIFGLDEHGRCTFINAAGAKALGYEREQLLGQTMHPLIHGRHADGSPYPVEACLMEQAAQTGRFSRVADEVLVRSDGSCVPVEYSANPMFQDGEARGAVIIFSDVSERTQTEEHMRQAAKLESLGVLAGGIAHDFNNLLTGVLGNASLLTSTLGPDDPNSESVQEIITASEKAAELTAQMLAYAGKSSFTIRTVNLCELLQEVMALIHSSIPRTAFVDMDCTKDLPIEADRTQIEQVIMNLVINAGEALPDGRGAVKISTGVTELAATIPAQPEPLPPGRYVVLEVADTGTGMAPDVLNHIFDPFFTTKFLGRGLGLAATLGIIRAHKGGITVDSRPGQGSTFCVYFPSSHSAANPHAAEPDHRPLRRGIETVLIVDDEETVRITASRALQQYGYRVLTAASGREAISTLTEHRGSVSLILLDTTMPGMSGGEAAKYLRTVEPAVPILVTSGYDESDARAQFMPNRFAGFIRKPYRAEQLVGAVGRLLGSEEPTLSGE